MKKIFAILLVLAMITGSALACGEVDGLWGDSYIRSYPSLYGAEIGVLPQGETAEFLFEEAMDERGVIWYLVDYYGTIGWVSSRYTALYTC